MKPYFYKRGALYGAWNRFIIKIYHRQTLEINLKVNTVEKGRKFEFLWEARGSKKLQNKELN